MWGVVTVTVIISQIIMGSATSAYGQARSMRYEDDTLGTMVEISRLLVEDSEMHGSTVRYLSKYLTPKQRLDLARSHEKSALGPFALNLFFGFGIGSYVQGSPGTGLFCTLSESIGGYYLLSVMGQRYPDDTDVLVGAIFFLTGRIVGLIAPWSHTSSENEQLYRNLSLPRMMFSAASRYDSHQNLVHYPQMSLVWTF